MLFLFIYSALRGTQKGFNSFVFSYANVLLSDVNCSLTLTTLPLLYSGFPKCNKPQLGGDRASKQ